MTRTSLRYAVKVDNYAHLKKWKFHCVKSVRIRGFPVCILPHSEKFGHFSGSVVVWDMSECMFECLFEYICEHLQCFLQKQKKIFQHKRQRSVPRCIIKSREKNISILIVIIYTTIANAGKVMNRDRRSGISSTLNGTSKRVKS